MQKKIKKCSGTGLAKGHGCGKNMLYRTYGLGHSCGCYGKWLFNTDEGKEKLKKSIIKAKKEVEKKKKREDRESKKDYNKLLTMKIQEIVRLIDYGQPCIARGVSSLNMQAGHVYAKGGNPAIKWNLHNIHRQCKQSNYTHEDLKLRNGIEKEYGKDYISFIENLKIIQYRKLSELEKKQAYNKALYWSNKLKKEGKTYELNERIELRNKINKDLSIYEDKYSIYYFRLNSKTS